MLKSKSKEQSEVNAATSLTTLGDAPAFFQNQMYAEAVANTQAMNQLRLAVVAKAVEAILNPSPGSEIDPAMLMALIDKLGENPSPEISGKTE